MTKPLTIKDSLYETLKKMKKSERESYSDVIEDLIKKSEKIDNLERENRELNMALEDVKRKKGWYEPLETE